MTENDIEAQVLDGRWTMAGLEQDDRHGVVTKRLAVPGGWLVTTRFSGHSKGGVAQTFVPDPDHTWVPTLTP